MKFFSKAIVIVMALIFLAAFAFALCGDGIVDAGEQCDKTNFNGLTCEKLDKGYSGGTLSCNSDCTISTGNCNNNSNSSGAAGSNNSGGTGYYCGDGVKGANEECDINDLGGKTCSSFGYLRGELSCAPQCIFDLSNCSGLAAQPSGGANNMAQPGADANGGIVNDERFPALNLFSASTIRSTLIPWVFTIVCIIWASLMFFAAFNLRNRRMEEEKREILSYVRK